MISFKVMGEPVGKGRPRVTARQSKKKDNAVFAHAYTPKKTKEYEDSLTLRRRESSVLKVCSFRPRSPTSTTC